MDIITKRRKELEEGVGGAIVGMTHTQFLTKFNSGPIHTSRKFSRTTVFMDFTPFLIDYCSNYMRNDSLVDFKF